MDALAGYGSDSESEGDTKPSDGGALSGLFGHYSDDSDDNPNDESTTNRTDASRNNGEAANEDGAKAVGRVNSGNDNGEISADGRTKKRRRRWDNPNEDDPTNSPTDTDIDDVLPPPTLATESVGEGSGHPRGEDDGALRSTSLFRKDYTKELRLKLSRQLRDQEKRPRPPNDNKLERARESFRERSFAAHLKSQKDFGNPRLLGSVIDHHSLDSLGSHVGNSFSNFERVDRLVAAEERARVARAAECDAAGARGMAGGGGPRAGA